jgi:uncharacterized protein YraI
MSFWKQIPGTTKVYIVLMIYLSTMFVVLVFARFMLSTRGGFSLKNFFAENGASETATAEYSFSSTATAQTQTNFPPGTPWCRASQEVKILAGPGEEYPTLAILEANQVAEITGASPDRSWWAIKVPYLEGENGWVASNQVVANNTADVSIVMLGDTTPTTRPPIDEIPNVRAFSNVNIRSGPDMYFQKIGLLKNGETAEVTGVSEDGLWWAIKLPGKEDTLGWVAKDYVVPSNVNDVPVVQLGRANMESIPPTPAPDSPSLTALYPVNIRAGPGVEYAVVAQLIQGQLAEVVGVSPDGLWIAIKLPSQKNGRGWVAGAYVKLANASDVPIIK